MQLPFFISCGNLSTTDTTATALSALICRSEDKHVIAHNIYVHDGACVRACVRADVRACVRLQQYLTLRQVIVI